MNEYLETILRYAFSGMEIFFVIFIFVRKAETRNAFIVRIMLALLAITASALLFSVVPFISQTAKWINEIIYYVYICGFTYIAINGIFKIEWKSLSFYSAIAITAGLLGNKTFEIINAFLGKGTLGIILSESVIGELLHISIMFLAYMFVYFVFIKKYNNIEQYTFENEKYLLPLIILVEVVLDVCEIFILINKTSNLLGLHICGICYCCVMLFVEYSFVYKG